jgi:type I restriction enzyme S subunit
LVIEVMSGATDSHILLSISGSIADDEARVRYQDRDLLPANTLWISYPRPQTLLVLLDTRMLCSGIEMVNLTKAQRDSIKREVAQRLPAASSWRPHWEGLLLDYGSSGLAPPNLVAELTCGDDQKFWAHVWEAMLFRHLTNFGVTLQGRVEKSGQIGPDFCFEHDGRMIWIEAVVPAPERIPNEWLAPPKRGEPKMRIMPHEEMLLRWTSVLRAKRDALETYIDKKIVAKADCTIIAVNCCRLSDFAMDDLGISQMPFAVEAVFPIGPLAVPVSMDGEPAGKPERVPRYMIRNHNGTDIPTGNFLDPHYANVSAIMSSYRKEMADGELPLTLVHNPLATVPLPTGVLGANKEYIAEEHGDCYVVRPLCDM